MHSTPWRDRLEELRQRAGLGGVSPRLLVAFGMVAAIAVTAAAVRYWPAGGQTSPQVIARSTEASAGTVVATAPASSPATPTASAWVHVAGAVRRPGVYEVPSGARVAQAIEKAGGVLGTGAAEGVNLARTVVDGEQIVVPTAEEWERSPKQTSAPAVAGGATLPGSGASGAAAATQGPVDLNSADVTLLDTLPGVGPSTAQKIVADREANGPFSSPEDLGRVPGIGPRKLEALKGLIVAN